MLAVVDGVPIFAVIFVAPSSAPKIFAIRDEHASFAAGRDDLVLAKRERPHVSDRTDRLTFVGRSVSLSAILDHEQTAIVSEVHDRVHVARPAGDMDRDDRLRLGCECRFNRLGRKISADRIDVGEDRSSTSRPNGAGRRNERARRNDHVVTRPDAQRVHRQLNRQRAVSQRNRMFAIDSSREFFFEEPAFLSRPVIHFAGLEHRLHGIALSFIKHRPRRERLLSHRCSAIRGEQIKSHVGILSHRRPVTP